MAFQRRDPGARDAKTLNEEAGLLATASGPLATGDA
jgi:hypothetical protein